MRELLALIRRFNFLGSRQTEHDAHEECMLRQSDFRGLISLWLIVLPVDGLTKKNRVQCEEPCSAEASSNRRTERQVGEEK